jgi:hypothetical protein
VKQKASLGIALAGWSIFGRLSLEIDFRNASLPHRLSQHAQRHHQSQQREAEHQDERGQLPRNPVA